MRLRCQLLLAIFFVLPAMAHGGDIATADSWAWLKQQLAIPTSLHVDKMPLNQVVRLLEQQTGLQMVIDLAALDDLGLSTDEEMSVSLDSVSLGTMLELAFEQLELTWSLRDRVIIITTEEEAQTHMFVRVYEVDDLLQRVDGYPDYDSLIDVIISTVDSDTWVENGGPEAEIRPLPSSNAIIISQTLHTHFLVEELLTEIRQVRKRQNLPISKQTLDFTRATITPFPAPAAPRRTYYQPSTSATLPREYE